MVRAGGNLTCIAARQRVGSAGGMHTENRLGTQTMGFFRLAAAASKAPVKNNQILKKIPV